MSEFSFFKFVLKFAFIYYLQVIAFIHLLYILFVCVYFSFSVYCVELLWLCLTKIMPVVICRCLIKVKNKTDKNNTFLMVKCAVKPLILTSNGEKSWLTRKARPPTGTTRNSTLKVSWFPS